MTLAVGLGRERTRRVVPVTQAVRVGVRLGPWVGVLAGVRVWVEAGLGVLVKGLVLVGTRVAVEVGRAAWVRVPAVSVETVFW